jgi:hypothetical protein
MSQPASSLTPPTLLDDRWLEKLTVDPQQPLIPVLRHADAMGAWVIVCAFLPTLYAVANRTLTEAGARQGLVSLQCLSAGNVSEFIDPTTTVSPAALGFQPMFMSWLTALSLRLFGVGNSVGHVASAYLCTAGLIMATYALARRLGGERLGLLSALLLAFNPHVLKLAQEPVSQSAAALFAVLAMTGTVAHWQKSSAQASVRLLFGGIALGLCLLAGGPVAVAVVAILLLHAALWRFGGWQRPPSQSTFEFPARGRRTAVRSVLILAATGFAVGGWRCLLMGSRYGADFWLTWLGGASSGAPFAAARGEGGWLTLVEASNALILPLAVLAIVGIAKLFWEQSHPDDDFVRRHRGLLLIWLAVAGILWAWRGSSHLEIGSVGEFWRIVFIVPLTIAAAAGVVAIIDRQISTAVVFAIGAATLVDVICFGAFARTTWGIEGLADYGMLGGVILAGAFVVPVLLLPFAGPGGSGEGRRRRALTGIVLGVLAVNSAWGGLAVRRTSAGDRELEDLRGGLARLTGVNRWTFVTPALKGDTPAKPPAQLLYTLRRVWPNATMLQVDSWAAVASQIAAGDGSTRAGSHLVVIFSPQGQARPAVPAGLLRAAAPPFVYRGHEIATYVPGEPPS